MITLFTGMPGAGKTAAMVDYLRSVVGERPLFVDGVEGLTLDHTEIDSKNWPALVPDGAVVVIDEVQRVWRPRGSGSSVPASVQELETHRHRGLDFYITTQSPRLVDANVRGLVGRHVHIRDVGILGRHWYEWPECNEAMAWKSCVNKRRFKLPKKAFDLYKSASMHIKPVRKIPLALIWAVLLSVALAIGAFTVYRIINRVGSPAPATTPAKGGSIVTGLTSSSPTQQAGEVPAKFIDDRIAWVPRISSMPESAPAYDAVRQVVNMPLIVGGMCMNGRCRCVTQQGTTARVTEAECRTWLADPPFDPYTARDQQAKAPEAKPIERGPESAPEGGVTIMQEQPRQSLAPKKQS